jgi:hypothetical protein
MTGIVAQVSPPARLTLQILGILSDLCMVLLGVLSAMIVPASIQSEAGDFITFIWCGMLIVGPLLAIAGTVTHRVLLVAPGLSLEAGGIAVWAVATVSRSDPPTATAVGAAFAAFVFCIVWRCTAAVIATPPRKV